jgi:hypothetical protein
MRAVVAFSRNSAIRGTTTLSKKLMRSPNNDVVLAATESGEELTVAERSGDDTATYTTKSCGGAQRQVAVWASDDNTTLGSSVTFDANLHRSDSDGVKSTAASSAFAPKSFELTIALTDGDNSDQAVVALPLGVASLAISGEESSKGKRITVDLPVYSLSQARPIGSSDRMGTYPMITLAPRQRAAEAAETIPGAIPLKTKRTGLKKLFSKKDKNNAIVASIPSVAKRNAFAAAYSMDSGGDAILRVTMEVYEKEASGGILSRAQTKQVKKPFTVSASKLKAAESPKDVSNRLDKPVARKEEETSADQESGDGTEYTEDTEHTEETEYSDDETDFTGSILTADEETITLDGSMVTTEDNRIAFFSWVNGPSRSKDKDKKCRRGEGKKGQPLPFFLHEDEEGMVTVNVLGRTIRFPSCGSLEVHHGDGRSRYGNSTVGDDLTHLTADFFGKSYHIPVCVGIAKKEDDDDDSTTSYTEGNVMSGPRIANVLNGEWCQSKGMESEEINFASTFSTLSEHDAVIETEKVTVSSTEKSDADDENCVTNEAKIPVPGGWSEADEIMRIVRSKPSRSLKDGAARKDVERFVAKTDVSPKGVVECLPVETEAPTTPKAKIVKNIAELFQCQPPQNLGPPGPRYEPFEAQVPSIIIHSEHDLLSVGELTATTHEQNIASEARLLDRARQIFNENPPQRVNIEQKEKRVKEISCVSGGFCSHLVKHDTVSSPIRVTSHDSSSIVEGHRSHHSREKYITDCDESTTFSPVEVEKVSSVEKGSSFSRVRDPSEDKPESGSASDIPAWSLYSTSLPVYSSIRDGESLSPSSGAEVPVRSLYSDSLPVYSSIGIGDGTESLLGAFTHSNNERERFNPMTGVEVDQAII